LTLNANETLALAQLKLAATLTNASAYNMVIDAHTGAFPTGKITIATTNATTTNEAYLAGEASAVTPTIAAIHSSDVLKLTIDGLSVTSSISATTTGTTVAHAVAKRLARAWNAKYGEAGTSSTTSLFQVSTDTAGLISIEARNGSGRRGYDKAYSIGVTAYSNTVQTPTLAWNYGTTEATSDNKTLSNGIVLTIASAFAGNVLDVIDDGVLTISATGASFTTLTSTLLVNGLTNTTTTKLKYPNEARGDAILPEGDIDEVATDAVSYSRVHWLAD